MKKTHTFLSTLLLFACIGSIGISPGFCAPEKRVRLYVSPIGNDAWKGTRAKPLASIEGARDAIRALKSEGKAKSGVDVFLREGTYRLDRTVHFTAEDSGAKKAPIVYRAARNEFPIVSGARTLSGWTVSEVDGRTVWSTDIPDVRDGNWWFRELFVDGERRPRTRLPETGYYEFTGLIDTVEKPKWSNGVQSAYFEGDDIKNWKNLQDVEIVALTRWIEMRMPIAEVDSDKHLVTFGKKSTFRLENTRKDEDFSRYSVENVFEALDQPGEWYLDRPTGKLYYIPREGEAPNITLFEAPALGRLIDIQGGEKEGEKVENLHFRNLRFRHAEWEFPADKAGSVQAAVDVPGAIYLKQTKNCSLTGCLIENVGTYGIELGAGCQRNRIVRCTIRDLGAGGVKVGHGSVRTVVSDNDIREGGRIYHSGIGVWVGNSGHNRVVHNNIHDFFYTGVSVGWSWGYKPTQASGNEIAYNHIYRIGQNVLSDMGAIYTLGVAEGSRLHHNLIHDINCHGFGGWGIYLDEGTTHMLVEDNLVYRAESGGFHIHYGKENTIRNSVFACADDPQLQRSRDEEHTSFDFVGNIVYYTQGDLLSGTWKNDNFTMNRNLYWNPNLSEIEFAGGTFEAWKARGHDKESVIADPLFVNPAADDYRLRPNSPAIEIGFKPLDLSTVGPRPAKQPRKK